VVIQMSSRRGGFAVWLVCFGLVSDIACRQRIPKDAAAAWDSGFITRAEAERYFSSLEARQLRTQSSLDSKSGVTEILSDLAFLKIMAAEAGAPRPGHPVLYLDARAALLVQYYVQRKGKRPHQVSDADALNAYKERLADRFTLPESCTFRHVFLRADRHSEEELARLERTVLDSLAKGIPFPKVVATYSESETARREGKVGPVYRGRMAPAFEKQLYLLKPGRPGVVHTEEGTHIVEILELRPSRVLPFEEVKQQIVPALMDRRNESEREQLMATLRARYRVVDRTSDSTAGPDEVVLRVKDRQMTRRELETHITKRSARAWSTGRDAKLQRRWVDDLVRSNLLYLDAVDSGLDREQAFVDQWGLRELTLRSKNAIDRRFEAVAKKVADDEVHRYFLENQGRFSMPKRSRASYLFMPFGGTPPFELEQRLEALEKLAAAPGADPAEIERLCTEAGAVFVDMGWATPEDAAWIAPEFQRRFIGQTTTGSTGVFKVEEGLFVILVRAIEASRSMAEPADHQAIRARYMLLRRNDMLREIKERELKERKFRVLSTEVFKSSDAKS
jgi:hypothetical protein